MLLVLNSAFDCEMTTIIPLILWLSAYCLCYHVVNFQLLVRSFVSTFVCSQNTLMETEYLLSKLQEFVGESEQKWRHLLMESENERNQLAARLEEANKTSREVISVYLVSSC